MDKDHILLQYNINDEFSEEWVEPKEFEELNLNESGELSRYALLRQLTNSNESSGELGIQDEPDPLGSTNSTVAVIQSRGIDVEDPAIRGQYLVSSSRFNPKAFLRDVHANATYNNLVNSLDFLESSIQEQSEALRFMVERDYDRFVKSKSMLDSVLDQVNQSGFNHEQGWGLGELKGFIDDSNSKLAVIMKPVIDNQARETRLKAALELIKKNKYLFNLPSLISKHIKNNDHDSLIRDYRRGKDMRYNENITSETPDYIIQNKKITDRIWKEVESIVDEYKKDTWKQLSQTGPEDNYMAVISKLLELGVEDNPIQEWIECQIQQYSDKAIDKFEKLTLKTNLMRMNLVSLPPTEHASFILPVKENAKEGESNSLCDSAEVIEMWLTIRQALDDISKNAEAACLFWKSCSEFLDGTRQRNLPTGYRGESKIHLSFNPQEVERIRQSGRSMIQLFAERIVHYFESPAPTQSLAGNRGSSSIIAPKTDKNQEESFLFLPPYGNGLSTVRYLSRILTTLSSSFRVLSQSSISNQASDSLRAVLAKIRERCISAVCFVWKEDSRKFSLLEDWNQLPNSQATSLPTYYQAYQLELLEGMKKLVHQSDEKNGSTTTNNNDHLLITQPSTRLLNYVLSVFLSSNSLILESLMNLIVALGDPNRSSYLEKSLPSADSDELTPEEKTNDAKVLLLLSNMSIIRDEILQHLYKFFESNFNTPTRDVNHTLRDTMDKMDGTMFELYTRRKRLALSEVIRNGITKPEKPWTIKNKPNQISSYIYECLLMLVVVHSKVSEVSADLVPRVVVVLNDHVIKQILQGLREVEQFSTGGMLQAVADVEFWRLTMTKFITTEAQKSLQLIYGTLKENVISAESWDTRTGPRPYVQDIVDYAAQESRLDFACFHK